MYKKITVYILIINLLALCLPQRIWAVGLIDTSVAIEEDCQAFVEVSLSSDHGGSGGGCNHTGTGGVVYPTIGFNTTNIEVNENSGTIDLPISLSFPPSNITAVNYKIAPNFSATAVLGQDYLFNTGRIELVPGQTQTMIHFTIKDDREKENAEIFQIELTDPDMTTFSGNEKVTITINDNDQVGLSFSKESYQVTRGTNPVGDSYAISLQSSPNGIATITPELIGSNQSLVSFSPEKLVFDSTNWESSQQIRIVPTDLRANFAQAGFQIKHNLVSDDPFYQGLVVSLKNISISNYYVTGSGGVTGGGGTSSGTSSGSGSSTGSNNTTNSTVNFQSQTQTQSSTQQTLSQTNPFTTSSTAGNSQITSIDPYSPNLVSAIPSLETKVVQKETNPFPGRVFILNTGKRSEAGQAIKNILVKEIDRRSLEEITVVGLSTIARFVAFGTNLTKDYSQEQRAKAVAKFQEQKKKLPTSTIELLETENLALVK